MSRPLQDEPFEALERALAEAQKDILADPTAGSGRLTALLHELSFRDGPRESLLKERAEALRIELVIAQKKQELARSVRPGATRETADAAASQRVVTSCPTDPARATSDDFPGHKDFPGFDPGPMLSEMSAMPRARIADDGWRKQTPHLAVLSISLVGIVALAAAQLTGAFKPGASEAAALQAQPAAAPEAAREVAQLPYIPMNVSAGDGQGELKPAGGVALAGAGLSGAGPAPNRPGVLRPVGRINLTTDLANLYSGEGPQIARAAVAAAGLGLNETVRWRNEKSGRYGTVTLIAQNPQRAACYTARITRLDTKTPQRRTQQLCF